MMEDEKKIDIQSDIKNNVSKTSDIIYKKKIKKYNKKGKKIILISILVIILVGISSYIIRKHHQDLNEIKIEEYELYQYFAGKKFEYTGEVSIKVSGEITTLKYKDIQIDVDSTPIYFKNIDNELLLPTNMGILIPRLMNQNYKLPFFSRISIEETEEEMFAFLVYGDEKIYLDKSFLYDGNNLYLFLYETKIVIDNQEIILSPLSYITVNYKGEISYYNKETDEYKIITSHNDDVIATFEGYKINLSTDMIIYNDDNSKLLIKNVNDLPTYKGNK